MTGVLQEDHSISHRFTCHIHTRTIPAFSPQPQGITALWLVLIALLPKT